VLQTILKLYAMSQETGVTSPLVHLFGPPGCGKSSVVRDAADLLGVQMHTINVSRISPLELEGVQMPTTTEEKLHLQLLHATFWTQLKDGDILLLDEFLRGFPEVYNGLLDILTAREVGGLKLPNVFIIAASNSVVAYDKALEDRLLHLPVPDARKSKAERTRIAEMLVSTLGLMPSMAYSTEMEDLISNEILPLYEMMDHLTKRTSPPVVEGKSVRHLIGQAQLRHVTSSALRDLIEVNNLYVANKKQWQYMFLIDGGARSSNYPVIAEQLLKHSDKLTPLQEQNTRLNLELIGLKEALTATKEDADE
jgi:hypothetical protein